MSRDDEAAELANNDLRQAGVALTEELDDLVAVNKESIEKAVTKQNGIYKKVTTVSIVLLVLSVLVLAFVVFICWKWVCKRLININAQLRDVIARAKANNMPNDTIDRGIKKAAGSADAVN